MISQGQTECLVEACKLCCADDLKSEGAWGKEAAHECQIHCKSANVPPMAIINNEL